MVRYYGWYSNRARGERAKREAEPGTPDTTDVDVIDVSEYRPPRIPSKKWRELIKSKIPIAKQIGEGLGDRSSHLQPLRR